MGDKVGEIGYDAVINSKTMLPGARETERIAQNVSKSVTNTATKSFSSFSRTASESFGGVATSIAGLVKVSAALAVGGAFGAGFFIKQASELQSMRASFEAMTGSAENAQKVLAQLNKFSFETAFSSESINAAARTLLASGLAVDDLGSTLKSIGDIAGATGADLGQLTLPLSQALARGKLQTQDFYQILNSGAGKLGQVLRKELADRGFADFGKAMEEGELTAEILFDTLNKAASKGGFAFEGAIKQSRTFEGQMSNLKETISLVALNILGVDRATGNIDADGVFAKISKAVQDATKWLNENRDTLTKVGGAIIDNIVPGLTALAAAFVAAKVAAVAFAIAAGVNPITLIAYAVIALVAAVTFLQVKFNIFGKALEWLSGVWANVNQVATSTLESISGWLTSIKDGALKFFNDRLAEAKTFIELIRDTADKALSAVEGWVDRNSTAIRNWSIVIGTLLLPKIIAIGVEFAKTAASAIASFATMAAQSVVQAAIATAAWVVGAAQTSYAWVTQTAPKMIASFAMLSAKAIADALIMTVAFVTSSVKTLASWAITFAGMMAGMVLLGVQALLTGAKMAAAWLLAAGPIGLIAALIIGFAALIVTNWDWVKNMTLKLWESIKNIFFKGINWIKANWLTIVAIIAGPIGLAVGLIIKNFDKIRGAVGSVFNWIKGTFSTIGDIAASSIKGVVNGVLGFAERTINNFINLVNGALDAINSIPGVSIGKVGNVNIPRLASGGIMPARPGGHLVNVAEGGEAEAVIPLSKLDKIMDRRSDDQSGGQETINLTLNIEGMLARSKTDIRWLGTTIIETIDEARRAKGLPEINAGMNGFVGGQPS